jgi:hypothetical protein
MITAGSTQTYLFHPSGSMSAIDAALAIHAFHTTASGKLCVTICESTMMKL